MNQKEPSARYWRIWYVIVLCFLVAQIIIFYNLTQYFGK